MTKGRVTNRRVISESYDFGELCSNHAQTTPTFPLSIVARKLKKLRKLNLSAIQVLEILSQISQ
jgi:hypothetical protein